MQIWRAKFETVSLVAVVPKIRFVPLEKKYPSTHSSSSFSPHFSMFYTPPNFTVYAERKLPAKCFKFCHILLKNVRIY